MLLPFNKTLAEAIIDMENIGYDVILGPGSIEKMKEWNKLVRFVANQFNLQDTIYDPELKKSC